MTIAEAKKLVSALGMTFKKTECGEFRVNYKGGRESTAYYAADIQDAIDTAKAMKGERQGK